MGWTPDLGERVARGDVTVAVVGLGYVGWPTAVGFREAGLNVVGLDVNTRRVESLSAEHPDEPGRWRLTTDAAVAVGAADVVLVAVPTPIDGDLRPDLSYIRGAGASVFDHVRPGSRTIVVLESTVYPGVTEETWLPLLAERGLVLGTDVDLAYCPERLNPGDEAHGVRQVARVIGSLADEVGQALVPLYAALTEGDVRHVGSLRVAESSKVVENVQRDLDIALVNELAMIFPALGIDIEDVLDAAATKWNFRRCTAGVGVGGHCIPVDPYYLIQRSEEAGVPTELISAGRAVNRAMPVHVGQTMIAWMARNGVLPDGARVLLLGWSYKPELEDARETPAQPLARELAAAGVEVLVWDPHVDPADVRDESVTMVDDPFKCEDLNGVILVTAHKACLELDLGDLLASMTTPLLYDGRRALPMADLESQGWSVAATGRPLPS